MHTCVCYCIVCSNVSQSIVCINKSSLSVVPVCSNLPWIRHCTKTCILFLQGKIRYQEGNTPPWILFRLCEGVPTTKTIPGKCKLCPSGIKFSVSSSQGAAFFFLTISQKYVSGIILWKLFKNILKRTGGQNFTPVFAAYFYNFMEKESWSKLFRIRRK